ncbi:MAG: 7-cyano-7-deazaguanine synthase [Candidatus Aenigmarchaeota archaeon]|nr:7-cyano-7-deazaguanine synthase [Candidatus Aenigmarchaeota archaeon]
MKSVIALISGGIDSPVAAYMVGRLGYKVIPVHFDNSPLASEANRRKAKDCVKRLKKHITIDDLVAVPHGKNLLEISRNCNRKYTCVLCRRVMFRTAEKLCKKLGAEAIVTGEFLGSKASQTLANLEVISQAVSVPILRPLLGLDKEEIQKIGKKIGTFGQDISPAGCCSIVPSRPSTKARLEKILEEESKIDVEERH